MLNWLGEYRGAVRGWELQKNATFQPCFERTLSANNDYYRFSSTGKIIRQKTVKSTTIRSISLLLALL